MTVNTYRECWQRRSPWLLLRASVCRQPTCLEDLISDGETCAVCLIVGHELDEELVSWGDDRRGCNLPTVLPHKLTTLVHAVSYLHIVIPGQDNGGCGFNNFTGFGFICQICSCSGSVQVSCTVIINTTLTSSLFSEEHMNAGQHSILCRQCSGNDTLCAHKVSRLKLKEQVGSLCFYYIDLIYKHTYTHMCVRWPVVYRPPNHN